MSIWACPKYRDNNTAGDGFRLIHHFSHGLVLQLDLLKVCTVAYKHCIIFCLFFLVFLVTYLEITWQPHLILLSRKRLLTVFFRQQQKAQRELS